MSLLSISEAARTVGRSRGTIHRYLKNGNLSSTSDDTGNIKIDTSELLRVFGELKTNGTAHTAPPSVPFEQQGTAYIETLKEQLKTAQEREKAALERENKLINMLEQEQQTRRELEQKILALPEGRAKKPGLFARLFNRI